ncbi:NUDIX domain-containing protein [Rhodophyticola sp. CCM32]|uniref:gamma-glutamylcyclotransferase n=1 Tax=Rhodophyticola sp. CCM32 TaxID=2916397 RepID=UPI00107F7424|nr:gamma-glutamylcyclotransferase [Rhodophyticola sp. CCM32]QBY00674.1 NUDIX domain-containing protein [Rhodophyticola sp. CCM32]
MDSLFFYGTLCYRPLLGLVLGRVPDLLAARLDGHKVSWAEGQSFPMIDPVAGAGAEGLLLRDVTEEDRARLDHYEGAFAYGVKTVEVETGAGPVAAHVYMPETPLWPAGAPWSLEDWLRDWGALTLEAAAEIMALYGTEDAASIATRFGMIRSRAQSRLRAADWERARSISADFTRDDIELAHLATPYRKFFMIEEYTARHRRFDGTLSAPVDRAVFRAADAVTLLPYDPLRDRVLLIEQLRLGAYAQGDRFPWLLEPVAGIIDAGEAPETSVRREALEEAGVEIGALHLVGQYYPSPGGMAQLLISYIGLADLHDDLPEVGGLDAEGEDIRSHLVGFAEAMEMLRTGELAVAPLIISIQWLAAHRDALRDGSLTA